MTWSDSREFSSLHAGQVGEGFPHRAPVTQAMGREMWWEKAG